MDEKKILLGIGSIFMLIAGLTFLIFWERGGSTRVLAGEHSVAMAQSDEHRGAAFTGSRSGVYRKKMRSYRPENGDRSFETVQQDVIRFFHSLDERQYIQAHGFPEGTYKFFLKVLADLSASPPIVSGETKDVVRLRLNMTHFERIIGSGNISLIMEILDNEKEILEPSAELLYEWIVKGIEYRNAEIKTSDRALSDYAAFFLTTLSGKSYLWRRDAKTRIIVTYYAILIIDRANRENLNRYNIDILPPISHLKEDLLNYRGLSRRNEYVDRLKVLEEEYSQ
ncbi:MAG: hypothetical protein NTV99_05640 [Deltaproteobacteria bacterium]|nr:hypothetical protein [Deltaproteobacteria bacterium]